MDKNTIREHFPNFAELELVEEISEYGIERDFKRGDSIIRNGEFMKYVPLIISGSIRVMREDAEGHEMLLYYLEGGNTCAMSITCCMRNEKSNIWAIAEEDSKVLLLPLEKMEAWMKKYSSWRGYIMNSYSSRMEGLLKTLDSIAFYSLDKRLLKYLADRSHALKKQEFSITHSEIARELNSSREAISRLLKKLETMGKIELGRNKIILTKEFEAAALGL
jgi:CRP/FNR family transcriptional regulator